MPGSSRLSTRTSKPGRQSDVGIDSTTPKASPKEKTTTDEKLDDIYSILSTLISRDCMDIKLNKLKHDIKEENRELIERLEGRIFDLESENEDLKMTVGRLEQQIVTLHEKQMELDCKQIRKEPFKQLWSIHAFIQKDGQMKQVPLLFVLMSRQRAQDYVEVLHRLLDVLGAHDVEGVVMDFEAACWNAVKEVLPGVDLRGCSFHWCQAVMRKVSAIGLKATYMRREGVHGYIRKLLALPFLPANQIEPAFQRMSALASTPELRQLVEYLDRVWFRSTVWRPANWCVYRQSVRTNNDVEGWHRRMNGKAGRANLPFYLLVPLLKKEGELVDLQLQLVGERNLARHQTTTYKRIQGAITELWDRLDGDDRISTSEFLRKVGNIYAPRE